MLEFKEHTGIYVRGAGIYVNAGIYVHVGIYEMLVFASMLVFIEMPYSRKCWYLSGSTGIYAIDWYLSSTGIYQSNVGI